MSRIATTLSEDGRHLTIHVERDLRFLDYRRFREIRESAPQTVTGVSVDFSQTRYLDSAGLGIVLSLQRYAQTRGWPVRLIHCRDRVAEMLGLLETEGRFVGERHEQGMQFIATDRAPMVARQLEGSNESGL